MRTSSLMAEFIALKNFIADEAIFNYVEEHLSKSPDIDIPNEQLVAACKSVYVKEFGLRASDFNKSHVKFLKKNHEYVFELLREKLSEITNIYYVCDVLAKKILSQLDEGVSQNNTYVSVVGVGPFQETINAQGSLVAGLEPQLMIEFDEETAQYRFKKNSPVFTLELVKILSKQDSSLHAQIEPISLKLDTVKYSGFGPVVWKENIFGTISQPSNVEMSDINKEFFEGSLSELDLLDKNSKQYKLLTSFILNICFDAVTSMREQAFKLLGGKATQQSELKREDLVIIRAAIFAKSGRIREFSSEFLQFIIRDDLLLNALNSQTGYLFNKNVASAVVDSVVAKYHNGNDTSDVSLDKTLMLSKHIWPRSSPIVFEVFLDRIPTEILLSSKVFSEVMNWGVTEENAVIYFEHIRSHVDPAELFKRSEHDLNVRARTKLREILVRFENTKV